MFLVDCRPAHSESPASDYRNFSEMECERNKKLVQRAHQSLFDNIFGSRAPVALVIWITSFAFVISWLLWIAWGILTAESLSKDYAIIIDAGSKGSRMHIYAWETRTYHSQNSNNATVTIPKELSAKAYSSDLAHLIKTPDSAVQYFRQFIADAKEELVQFGVERTKFPEIPLYLKATAGMRVLDQLSRDLLMETVRSTLRNSQENPFLFHGSYARVISGEEEGVYGWVAVNSQRGSLLKNPVDTLGALDLGGASAQITFSPFRTSILEDFNDVRFGTHTIRLYSHSFLAYGWTDSMNRVSTLLGVKAFLKHVTNYEKTGKSLFAETNEKGNEGGRLTGTGREKVVVKTLHPCFPTGLSFNYELPSFNFPGRRLYVDLDPELLRRYMIACEYPPEFVREIVSSISPENLGARHELQEKEGGKADLQLGGITLVPNTKVKIIIKFSGTSDAKSCTEKAKSLFFNSHCLVNSCSFNGVYQPRLFQSQFMAFGQYSKVFNALKHTIQLQNPPALNDLKKAVDIICSKSLKELRQYREMNDVGIFSRKGMKYLCWKGVWAHTALVHGFGFHPESQQIKFSPLVEDNGASNISLGWALGSMIIECSFYPKKVLESPYKGYFYMVLAFCLVLLAIVLEYIHKNKQLKVLAAFSRMEFSDREHTLVT